MPKLKKVGAKPKRQVSVSSTAPTPKVKAVNQWPHSVRAIMPDGRKVRIGGRHWKHCLDRAAEKGAAKIVDRQGCVWERIGKSTSFRFLRKREVQS